MKNTIDANTDTPCACCGRTHRKLYITKWGALGATCLEQVKIYTLPANPEAVRHILSPRQFKKIETMIAVTAA